MDMIVPRYTRVLPLLMGILFSFSLFLIAVSFAYDTNISVNMTREWYRVYGASEEAATIASNASWV